MLIVCTNAISTHLAQGRKTGSCFGPIIMLFDLSPLQLQDRESYVALLVGAKHGVSQIINSKLSIITSLAEFTNISRVELTEESEKVSMVKIYLQDLKVGGALAAASAWQRKKGEGGCLFFSWFYFLVI